MDSQLLSYFYLISVFTSMMVGLILVCFRSSSFYRYSIFLGFHFIFISFALLVGFLFNSGMIIKLPHFYRTGNLFIYLAFPFSFFYVKGIIKDRPISYVEWLLFLPLLFYMVDFFPFFLKAGEEKLRIIEAHKNGTLPVLSFTEGWLTPQRLHVYIRQLYMLVIWVLQFRIIITIESEDVILADNKNWFNWIKFFQFQQTFYWLPTLVFIFFAPTNQIRLLTETLPVFFLLLIQFYLFYKPTILYDVKMIWKSVDITSNELTEKSLHQYSDASENRLKNVMHKLEVKMTNSRPFLIHGYALYNLAGDVGEPPRLVSLALNRRMQISFNEYINQKRIDYFIELIESGVHKTRTIEALAKESGFSNRTSFIRAFKKYKDATPKEFIKNFSIE